MTGETVKPNGWHVEIDGPNGYTHTPQTKENVRYTPKEGGLPEIEVPIESSDKWSDDRFEDAPMRVWFDGQRQPIETLINTLQETGNTILLGRGGGELETPVEVSYDTRPSHEVVEELISEHTSYTPHVDTPETTRSTNTSIQSATTQEDFQNIFAPADTSPLNAAYGGKLTLHQTCRAYAAPGDQNRADFVDTISGDQYNSGQAYHFKEAGDRVVFHVPWPYRLPSSYVGIKIRDELLGESNIEFRWGGGASQSVFSEINYFEADLRWKELGSRGFWTNSESYQNTIGQDLDPDQGYWLGVVATGDCDYVLDSAAVYDTRYSYTWPNPGTGNNGAYLEGPELYPDKVWTLGEQIPLAKAVVGAELESTWNRVDTVSGGKQRVGFSPSEGEYVITSPLNASTVDLDQFDTPGASITSYFVLSRAGDDPNRGEYPTKGFETHEIKSFSLHADVEDLPLVIDQQFDTSLLRILNQIAGDEFLWEVAWDESEDGISIEWTQPGQRVTDRDIEPSQYTVERSTADMIDAASVYGATRDFEDYFYANVGNAAQLAHSRLHKKSDSVSNPRTGEELHRGQDYKIDERDGTITALPSGRMESGDRYLATYKYNTYGEFIRDGVGPDDAEWLPPQDVSPVISNAGCRQAARELVDRLSVPKLNADITIPETRPGWSLVESIRLDDPLVEGRVLDPKTISMSPGETSAEYGFRDSYEEVVDDLSDQLEDVQRHS